MSRSARNFNTSAEKKPRSMMSVLFFRSISRMELKRVRTSFTDPGNARIIVGRPVAESHSNARLICGR